MNKKLLLSLIYITQVTQFSNAIAPLGLFVPYDINMKMKKPAVGNFHVGIFGEKSYNVKGYSIDTCLEEEPARLVNPLQIYEEKQNLISLYQGLDPQGNLTTNTGEFTKLLDSISGGAGGGVSNIQNGLFTPTGEFSCGQFSLHTTYGVRPGFYVSAYLPVYFARLQNVCWEYAGNNTLFSGQKIQQELVDAFVQDTANLFDLNVTGWEQNGLGDLTFLLEWEQTFPQRRPILKSAQPHLRLGVSAPTGVKRNENIIMPIPFGADGAVSIPFGGGLTLNLAERSELGFSGQFWYFWNNQKCRRVKTFPTQTSLLYPVTTETVKDYSFLQNFNLFAKILSSCKRVSLQFCYQYWRRGEDIVKSLNPILSNEVINSAQQLLEETRHNVILSLNYSPKRDDFSRVIPQAQFFWKAGVKGSRTAIASSFGGQFSLIF